MIKKTASQPWILGSADILLFLREKGALTADVYNEYKIQLIDWVNENISNDKKVPFASSVEDCFWYSALSEQRMEKYAYYYTKNNNIDYLSNLKNADYVIVDITSEPYNLYKDYFDSLEKVYQNYIGFIAVLE